MNIRISVKEFISVLVDCGAFLNRHPLVRREDSEVVYVVSPRPGRSLGRLPKPCAPPGQRTSGGPDVGAFPGRAILWARVPYRKWVLSPGEPYPGRECLLGWTIMCILDLCIIYPA